ncbi:MAG: HdeD family acid-resistance protein [Caldilineaceae bacterium]|nr:HdeD family acid-resistance protein [Caldilineaceae bacterium]
MIALLSRNWWVLAIRGVAAILLGIAAFVWPEMTLTALILLFGAYALVDGIFAVIVGIVAHGESDRWWMMIVTGLAGIAAGAVTLLWPGITVFVLLYVIAAWAVLSGILEIAAAIRLRKEIEGEWLLGLAGAASVIFGILLVVLPGPGAVALIWLIGIYALMFGFLLLVLSFEVRDWREDALQAEAHDSVSAR